MQLVTKLYKMKIILISGLLMSVLTTSCQVNWNKTSNWTLYRYQGHGLFSISIDSLHSFQNIPLSQDSIQFFLSQVAIKHPRANTQWMGGYIVTCQIEGSLRKVVISNYGGFFYDQLTKSYYQIPTEKIDDWLSFIQNAYLNMIGKK